MNGPPQAPCYVVIFHSRRSAVGEAEYQQTARRMAQLAAEQPGFLGVHSARNPDGSGITVSYWRNLEDIQRWKQQPEHLAAQRLGQAHWYTDYRVEIARIEKGYTGEPSCSSDC